MSEHTQPLLSEQHLQLFEAFALSQDAVSATRNLREHHIDT